MVPSDAFCVGARDPTPRQSHAGAGVDGRRTPEGGGVAALGGRLAG